MLNSITQDRKMSQNCLTLKKGDWPHMVGNRIPDSPRSRRYWLTLVYIFPIYVEIGIEMGRKNGNGSRDIETACIGE